MRRDVYFGLLKIKGEEHAETLREANNYAWDLLQLRRFEEAKTLLRKIMPAARRVLGESRELTLLVRWNYAQTLYKDDGATLDDLREAVTTGEDIARIARRVLGDAHPLTSVMERHLRNAQDALYARGLP